MQDEKDPSVWKIEFNYRSTRACIVEIFFVATELAGVPANDSAVPQRRKNHRQVQLLAATTYYFVCALMMNSILFKTPDHH